MGEHSPSQRDLGARGAAFPQVAPEPMPIGCGSQCGSQCGPHTDCIADELEAHRVALNHLHIGSILLGAGLTSAHFHTVSVWFFVLTVCCLTAGIGMTVGGRVAPPRERG